MYSIHHMKFYERFLYRRFDQAYTTYQNYIDLIQWSLVLIGRFYPPQNSTFFKNFKNQNLHFWIFFKNSFRNELQWPFLPYFDTQHSICEIFSFLFLVVGGSQGVQKSKNIFYISKNYFNRGSHKPKKCNEIKINSGRFC